VAGAGAGPLGSVAAWSTLKVEYACDSKSIPWHPDPVSKDGCSNKDNVPDAWYESSNALIFDSVFDCCQEIYLSKNSDCVIRDDCMILGGTSTGYMGDALDCVPALWHVDFDTLRCSNAHDYPAGWSLATGELYEDAACCCSENSYFLSADYPKEDICAPLLLSSCPSAPWHWDGDHMRCTNSHDYPTAWLDEKDKYFYDDADACCTKLFNYVACPKHDICTSSSQSPTGAPTSGPSPTPTRGPSPEPTRHPSSEPTRHPSSEPTRHPSSEPTPHRSSEPTRHPSSEPTRHPSSKPFTLFLVEGTGDSGIVADDCSTKNKKQCIKATECTWDAVSCVTVEREPEPVGDDSAGPSNDCSQRPWHPTLGNPSDHTCLNSDYPAIWNVSPYKEQYLFQTAWECCSRIYNNGRCNKVNVCS